MNQGDGPDPSITDRDEGSTWSTTDGAADIEDLVNERDLADFLVEPVPDTPDTSTP
jgi:hypothetical protein